MGEAIISRTGGSQSGGSGNSGYIMKSELFVENGNFIVPSGLRNNQVKVMLFGGGACGNGSMGGGGGYLNISMVNDLIAGQVIPVNIGSAGSTVIGSGGSSYTGGTTFFGAYASALGGCSNGDGGTGGGASFRGNGAINGRSEARAGEGQYGGGGGGVSTCTMYNNEYTNSALNISSNGGNGGVYGGGGGSGGFITVKMGTSNIWNNSIMLHGGVSKNYGNGGNQAQNGYHGVDTTALNNIINGFKGKGQGGNYRGYTAHETSFWINNWYNDHRFMPDRYYNINIVPAGGGGGGFGGNGGSTGYYIYYNKGGGGEVSVGVGGGGGGGYGANGGNGSGCGGGGGGFGSPGGDGDNVYGGGGGGYGLMNYGCGRDSHRNSKSGIAIIEYYVKSNA